MIEIKIFAKNLLTIFKILDEILKFKDKITSLKRNHLEQFLDIIINQEIKIDCIQTRAYCSLLANNNTIIEFFENNNS
ncbi:MAG: hypothetical protein ACTSQP_23735 [Promethearchaeota archaeon]